MNQHNNGVQNALKKSAKWLLNQQTQEGGWAGQTGHEPNTLNTA